MKFDFDSFNHHRYCRGADAARVLVTQDDGETNLLWMSETDISKNVALFGPHFALLKAAGQYGVRIAPLVAAWRDGADERFLSPVEPVRSRDGHWRHPHWPQEENDAIMENWLKLIGFEIEPVWLSGDDSAEDVQARWETGDCDFLAWQPKPPAEAAGWFIASIHDHEDGPVCIWARDTAGKGDAV